MSSSNSVTLATLPPERLGPYPPAGLTETTVYKDKKNGRYIKIADIDFGSKKYPKSRYIALTSEELDEFEFSSANPLPAVITHSLFTKAELISPDTRLKDIQSLPEYKLIPNNVLKKLRSKQDYVDAVMAVRESTTPTPVALPRSTF